MSTGSLRVGIVGARRVRQGLGPFLARDFARLGHRVVAVRGTSRATAEAAAAQVTEVAGLDAPPRAAVDEDGFFDAELDAVVVASPAGSHGELVRGALERGCHVLAEKPLLWHPETRWAERARGLEDLAAERGLVLEANAQWPHTLPAWASLVGAAWPYAVDGPGVRLTMGLCPSSAGRQMIGDALPHPLSMAQALVPGLDRARDVAIEHLPGDRLRASARLDASAGGAFVDLLVELRGLSAAPPREAWFEIDGQRVDRCIRPADYALFLRRGPVLEDLPDPLSLRVAAFCARVLGPRPGQPDRTLSRRASMLADIDAAWSDVPPVPSPGP